MNVDGVDFAHAKGPEGCRIYAIGDVHGRFDLLEKMHAKISAELTDHPPPDWRIIHLGDYVDRGPQSKSVLDFLIKAQERDNRISSLLGNHDVGFLEFLALAEPYGIFAMNGGNRTALSYGVTIDFGDPDSIDAGFIALNRVVPQSHVEFLKHLPLSATHGDFFFCHAGIRPGIPLKEQDPTDLIWIRHDFLDDLRLHPKVIVHGHTPVPVAEIMPNRIDIDTGAFHTGVLTALVIDGGKKQLIEVKG